MDLNFSSEQYCLIGGILGGLKRDFIEDSFPIQANWKFDSEPPSFIQNKVLFHVIWYSLSMNFQNKSSRLYLSP